MVFTQAVASSILRGITTDVTHWNASLCLALEFPYFYSQNAQRMQAPSRLSWPGGGIADTPVLETGARNGRAGANPVLVTKL